MNSEKDFIVLIQDNHSLIYKITSFYSSNSDEQKDLYQEVVYQMWKSFKSFENRSKVTTWMYRLALNTCITYIKKETRKKNIPNFELQELYDDQDSHFEEQVKVMYQQIQMLNKIEKGIILLYLEGKSYDEMAEITGFSPSNIGTRISRIKNKIRSKIKEEKLWN